MKNRMSGKEQLKPAAQQSSRPESHGGLSTKTQKSSMATVNLWFDYNNELAMKDGQGPSKIRYRPLSGGGHTKHRRTRSGCFTCRSRRIKVGVINYL